MTEEEPKLSEALRREALRLEERSRIVRELRMKAIEYRNDAELGERLPMHRRSALRAAARNLEKQAWIIEQGIPLCRGQGEPMNERELGKDSET